MTTSSLAAPRILSRALLLPARPARCTSQWSRKLSSTRSSSRDGSSLSPSPSPSSSSSLYSSYSCFNSVRASTARRPMLPGPATSIRGTRTIFIQTESTPNADALKFLPNHRVVPPEFNTPFIEYLNPRSTISPPHPSPLAAKLMNIDGITSVFYGADFITVTKAGDANWAHIRPEVFSLITEAITSGEKIVNVAERRDGDGSSLAAGEEADSLAYDENDSEVVGMIKELLETRIRPAIQEDGGDIEFRGFEDGFVKLKLRGACRTCDSSTVTLKNGIEGMLMHY
ncbi:hypothetical protein E4U55_001915, partial [Claviceps digitariae]